jgi:uncharacterized membrane protein YecN with MAPEG domain
MAVAIVCTALLGLLVFGLGLAVSLARQGSAVGIGAPSDPTSPLLKRIRAHGNATEYAPMFAILMLVVGAREPATWMTLTMVVATVSRYLHAAGMLASPTLAEPHPLRYVGSVGTYVSGLVLVLATVLVAGR